MLEGLQPLVTRTAAGVASAIFRITAAGLFTLRVAGAGAGAYALELHAAGDVNGDTRVDGLDLAALADVDGDGVVDSADSHLLVANLGFSPNQAPVVGDGSGFTHVELETAIAVSTFVTDPEGDPLTYRILSAAAGTARLSGDGTHVLFMPAPGFSGDASFVLVADDGWSHSAAKTVTVHVSAAPLVRLDFAQRVPKLALGNLLRPTIVGDFADQAGVVLPVVVLHAESTAPGRRARRRQPRPSSARTQGFAALVAARGAVVGATAIVVGSPSQFDEPQLFTGLDVFPHAVTLVPATGAKQITVHVDDVDVTAGALFFPGNPAVATVDAGGVVHGVAVGSADVTVIYRGAELVIKVAVRAPQQEQAVLDADGGALVAADGAVIAIAPDALDSTRTVSFRPVAEAALPKAIPDRWTLPRRVRPRVHGRHARDAGAARDPGSRLRAGRQDALPDALRADPRRERDPAPDLVAGRDRGRRRRPRRAHEQPAVARRPSRGHLHADGRAARRDARARLPHDQLPGRDLPADGDARRLRDGDGRAVHGRHHRHPRAEVHRDPEGRAADRHDGRRAAQPGCGQRRRGDARASDGARAGGAGRRGRTLRVPQRRRRHDAGRRRHRLAVRRAGRDEPRLTRDARSGTSRGRRSPAPPSAPSRRSATASARSR